MSSGRDFGLVLVMICGCVSKCGAAGGILAAQCVSDCATWWRTERGI